jgi:hypothetical protein
MMNINKELTFLFNEICNLHESLFIKDENTAITIAILNHDMDVNDKIIENVKKMKYYIDYGKLHNIDINENYIAMYQIYEKE